MLVVAACGTSKPGGSPSTSSTTRAASSTSSTVTTRATPRPTTTTSIPSSTTSVAIEPAVVVRHGDEHHRWVALTFDAGSDTGNTANILDQLAARSVHASFSLTGAWARANPELVRRITREGHTLVNHSDTHRSFTGFSTHTAPLSGAERAGELARADAAIAAISGHSTVPWFRPPYGDVDAATTSDVARSGYRYVLLWTVDSLGWKGLAPDDVAARCLDGAAPGAILLLHVGSASTDAAALPRILDGLQARAYEFVTVAAPGFITR